MAYSNDSKASATVYDHDSEATTEGAFLLKEDEYFLLLEDGYKIVLSYFSSYVNDAKAV